MNVKTLSLEATLKQCSLVAERMRSGKEFHMEGPATENAPSPNLVLVFGVV